MTNSIPVGNTVADSITTAAVSERASSSSSGTTPPSTPCGGPYHSGTSNSSGGIGSGGGCSKTLTPCSWDPGHNSGSNGRRRAIRCRRRAAPARCPRPSRSPPATYRADPRRSASSSASWNARRWRSPISDSGGYPTTFPTRRLSSALAISGAPLSHPVGLTRPIEMPASANAEDQRNEGEVPST